VWLGAPAEGIRFIPPYHTNSMELHSREMKRLQKMAAAHEITLVMGYSEREGGSRYMSQVIIGEQGDILLNRRKVKPTHVERTVYGEGDGSDLRKAIGADTVSPRPFEGVASLAFEFAILTAARSGEVFGGTSGRD
jgi:predicted amidohydrolase